MITAIGGPRGGAGGARGGWCRFRCWLGALGALGGALGGVLSIRRRRSQSGALGRRDRSCLGRGLRRLRLRRRRLRLHLCLLGLGENDRAKPLQVGEQRLADDRLDATHAQLQLWAPLIDGNSHL